MEINDVIDEIESVLEPPRLSTLEEVNKKSEEEQKARRIHEIVSRL
jgi:hypothetical protein